MPFDLHEIRKPKTDIQIPTLKVVLVLQKEFDTQGGCSFQSLRICRNEKITRGKLPKKVNGNGRTKVQRHDPVGHSMPSVSMVLSSIGYRSRSVEINSHTVSQRAHHSTVQRPRHPPSQS